MSREEPLGKFTNCSNPLRRPNFQVCKAKCGHWVNVRDLGYAKAEGGFKAQLELKRAGNF